MSEEINQAESEMRDLHIEGMLSQPMCGKAPAKRPRSLEPEEMESPDIEGYLDDFYLEDTTKVALLRSYANYLSAKLKAQKENLRE